MTEADYTNVIKWLLTQIEMPEQTSERMRETVIEQTAQYWKERRNHGEELD